MGCVTYMYPSLNLILGTFRILEMERARKEEEEEEQDK